MTTTEATPGPGMRMYVAIWIGLLVIVGIEVALTYARLPAVTLLAGLLALAIVEAALGVMFFMHLRYERRALFWSLIPGLIFVLLMLNQLWPDAYRLLSLHH
ncbi:MAG: cytochrome C oxidase subunit IV family protein [Actinoallomurus sp.]